MKTEKNILIAFLLNFSFSILEIFGGIYTNSVAIISDAVHDMGDSLSIGVSYFLEKKSKKKPDDKYTYGYVRFSVLGSIITTIILLVGSLMVIYNGILRIINPVEVNYNGMLIFAIFGGVMNFIAAYYTREGDSLNQKSVNLHMLEDVLGWVLVLIGALIMRFTDIRIIDPILSIVVALFIFYNAFKNLFKIVDLFLEKTPENISIDELKSEILSLEGIMGIHHIHIWSIDGYHNYATMHIVSNDDSKLVKDRVKEKLREIGIVHSILELEKAGEHCDSEHCDSQEHEIHGHHHHHHHHH